MAAGITLYVVYRRGQGKSLTQRFTIPAEALQETRGAQYGSILVPVFGEELDDDIVGTAGRLAASASEEEEGGAVLEALYVFEIPMSLPIDARVPEERVQGGEARARPRQGGGGGVRRGRGGHRHGARAARWARRSSRRRAAAASRRSSSEPRSPAACAAA